MRIGILASLHHPIRPPFAGGLERHTHLLAAELTRRGHEVVVFAAGDAAGPFRAHPIRDVSRPLRMSELARTDPSMLSEQFLEEHHAYLGLLTRIDDHDLDVLHDNCLHYLPVAMAAAFATPMTMTLHTPPTPWLTSALGLAGPRAPRIAAVSHATAHAWRDTAHVDRVIPNGIDLRRWRPGPRPRAPHAVWTGRITPEKGLHMAIAAAHQAGVPLHVAGPVGQEDYARETLALLGPRDRYLGHLDGDELEDVVRTATVQVVSPAWDEPYGLVVAEALACDTPVAAFDRGGIPEVVDDSCAVLAPPDDVDGLAAAILLATAIPPGRARRRAETVACHRVMVDAYERLFEDAVVAS